MTAQVTAGTGCCRMELFCSEVPQRHQFRTEYMRVSDTQSVDRKHHYHLKSGTAVNQPAAAPEQTEGFMLKRGDSPHTDGTLCNRKITLERYSVLDGFQQQFSFYLFIDFNLNRFKNYQR